MLKVFDSNDSEYLAWLDQHPDGFVINTRRNYDSEYMVLHRTVCSSICKYSKTASSGGFTERNYVKICADSLDELRQWVGKHGRVEGSFSGECSRCMPFQGTL